MYALSQYSYKIITWFGSESYIPTIIFRISISTKHIMPLCSRFASKFKSNIFWWGDAKTVLNMYPFLCTVLLSR